MRKRLVISLLTVASIAAISSIAFAHSFDDEKVKHEEKSAVQMSSISVTQSSTTASPTEAPTPEATEKVSNDWGDKDEYLLARIAMAEAEGEDAKGKALVVCVVLNRVSSSEFPNSIEEVIYQPRQFSPISNGRFDSVEPDEDCYEALSMVESGWDKSQGAMYFEAKSSSTWHSTYLEFLFKHGNHYFYKDKE